MECRKCGECCRTISISSPVPGMKEGKPAGVRCPQLGRDNLCLLYGKPERPEVCLRFGPAEDTCGSSPEEARELMRQMEEESAPGRPA